MKYAAPRPFADSAVAARKLVEIANATEAVQDGRIYIETINGQFLFKEGGTPEEYGAGLKFALTGLAVEARVRHVCEIHLGWCRPVHVE